MAHPENTRTAADPKRNLIHVVYNNIPQQALCGHTLTEQDEIPIKRDAYDISAQRTAAPNMCADCVQPLYTLMLRPSETVMSFLRAMRNKYIVHITHRTAQGNTRSLPVAPLDYGPSRASADKTPKLHMWDISGNHVLSLKLENILVCKPLPDETFDPQKIVTWEPNWHVLRNW